MPQSLLKSPDTISVTATPQAVTLPETSCWYTIRNAGSGSVYYFSIATDDYTAATYLNKTAATLRTANCSMVKSGETVAFFTDYPHIYLVCSTDGGATATANIEAGILGVSVNVEANLGNVGILDKAEAEIEPAGGQKSNVAAAAADQLSALGIVRKDTRALPEAVADGDWVAAQATANGDIRVRDDDADTKSGTTGVAAATAGTRAAQLRYIGDNIDELHVNLDDLDATASWAASTDASGITQETDHVAAHGITNSLSMDNAATVAEGSYGKTITSVDASVMAGDAVVAFYVKHINFTNVANIFVRIGSSDANYEQYQVDPAEFSATLWNHVTLPLHNGIQAGTGINLAAITYVAFGVLMDGTEALTEIFFNDLEIHSVAAAEFQVTTGDVTSNTVRVTKVGTNSGGNWPKGAGATDNATPRVTISNDDALLAAVKTAAEGAEDELDGTTATGPLADIKALANLTPVDEQATVLSVTTSNQTTAVVVGTTASYILTAVDGIIYAGFNATVATTANRAWVIPASQSRIITMPAGETTLNYIGAVSCTGYLQKVTNT